MVTRGTTAFVAVLGLLAGSAGAQTTFLVPQRDHSFMGTPSRMPERNLGPWGGRLRLRDAVDITPPRAVPFGGYGSYGGYPGHTGYSGYRGEYRRHDASGMMMAPDGAGYSGVPSGAADPSALRHYFDGSSLSLRGRVRSGDLDLAISLGTDPLHMGRPDHKPGHKPEHPDGKPPHVRPRPPIYPVYPYYPYYRSFYSPFRYPWYGYDYPRYPIDGSLVVYQMQQPAQPTPPPVEVEEGEELTDAQRAALLLAAGEVERSISLLRSHLNSEPDDAQAMRLLALALLVDGDVREATALMAYAYEANRSLAHEPLGEGNLRGGSRELREAVRRAVKLATEEDSASAWLTVSVLMQAEGRDRRALEILERAWRAGLDERVYEAMRAALGG